jgi:hypothetical protein
VKKLENKIMYCKEVLIQYSGQLSQGRIHCCVTKLEPNRRVSINEVNSTKHANYALSKPKSIKKYLNLSGMK